MTISELIQKLEHFKAEHGDVVVARQNHDSDYGYELEDIETIDTAEVDRVGGFQYEHPRGGTVGGMKIVVLS